MRSLSLHEFHLELTPPARFTGLADGEVVSDYGDWLSEHRFFTETAGVIDLSARGRVCLLGADRQRFLHGQVTNDVNKLEVGQGCYAAIISGKGKMQADLNIFRLEDEILLDFEPGLTAAIIERLEKYIIADDVQVVDVDPHYGLLSVQGPKAEDVVGRLDLGMALPAVTQTFAKVSNATLGDIYVVNQPRLGSAGFDLFVPVGSLGAVADKLILSAKQVGGGAAGWTAFDAARIEAGVPRFGVDMDETNLPPEAGLETKAISYSKGCYIGQEVIARIRTYGQVAKALRGLNLSGGLPARGDKLVKDGKEVGYITSALQSPKLNAPIALAYVRKECNQPGTELAVRTAAGEINATVATLPFS